MAPELESLSGEGSVPSHHPELSCCSARLGSGHSAVMLFPGVAGNLGQNCSNAPLGCWWAWGALPKFPALPEGMLAWALSPLPWLRLPTFRTLLAAQGAVGTPMPLGGVRGGARL